MKFVGDSTLSPLHHLHAQRYDVHCVGVHFVIVFVSIVMSGKKIHLPRSIKCTVG